MLQEGTSEKCLVSLHAQAAAGGDAELAELRKMGVSAEGVELVGALLAPRQADRISVTDALHRHPGWLASTC